MTALGVPRGEALGQGRRVLRAAAALGLAQTTRSPAMDPGDCRGDVVVGTIRRGRCSVLLLVLTARGFVRVAAARLCLCTKPGVATQVGPLLSFV